MKSTAHYIRRKFGKRARDASSSSSQSNNQSGSQPQSEPDEEVQMAIDNTNTGHITEQPAGDTYGIIFVRDESVADFVQMRTRKLYNTKFYSKHEMTSLGINEGVQILFKNIGWDGFLKWDEVGYVRPTLEFLSSCTYTGEAMYFRMYNQSYTLTAHQVCQLADASLENTFNLHSLEAPQIDLSVFWHEITGLGAFEPRHAKTSSIVHPTLRVAARLLTVTFFAREEAGTINTTELFILWCMVTKPNLTPNFGSFLLHKLYETRSGRSTPIHSCGLITKLIQCPDLDIQIPDGEVALRSERYLSKANLIRGHLLKEDPSSKTFTWLLGSGKVPHLALKRKDFGLLKLKRPVSNTNWCLPSNISHTEASGSGRQQGDEGAGTSTHIPEPARYSDASFFSGFQSNYDHLHSDYQNLHGMYTSLHTDYTALYGSYSSMNSDLSALRQDFDDERTESQHFRADVRTYMSEQRDQQSGLNDMINSLFSWHISEHPPPPPQ